MFYWFQNKQILLLSLPNKIFLTPGYYIFVIETPCKQFLYFVVAYSVAFTTRC